MNRSSRLDNLSQENREILEKIIFLIENKYKDLESALIYCEEISGDKPTVAYNNIRDFFSHLRSLFKKWDNPKEDKIKQLSNSKNT